ncbi:MAG: THxN family PEP-CTERM protein [Crocosphaera sp.]|nr:THxN family PEP-CTERM protein [Crocosphaera sp.]
MNIKTLAGASAVVLALGFQATAQAASVNTSGTWSNITGNPVDLNGVGTNQINWGNPFNLDNAQSGYVFAGVNGENVTLPTAFGEMSNVFDLGTFIHNNFTITGGSITGATLNIEANFINGSNETQTFSFGFSHFETPNNAVPCAAGGSQPCPDLVSFLNNGASSETVTIDGTQYRLDITGFQLEDGTVVQEFLTLEGQANMATLQGKLTAVPEPLTMLGAGAAIGFGGFFKRKLSKKNNKKA